jgi:hypothetical protein
MPALGEGRLSRFGCPAQPFLGESRVSLRNLEPVPKICPRIAETVARRRKAVDDGLFKPSVQTLDLPASYEQLLDKELLDHTNPDNKNPRFPGILEPSDGLEPSTPSLPSSNEAGTAGKAGSRGHERRARTRIRPKARDRAWTPVPALVFPQSSLASCPVLA